MDKKSFLDQKQCFLGKKCTITWYILHIMLIKICKFAITRKYYAFVAKIVNMRLTEVFKVIFALAERLPTSATLFGSTILMLNTYRVQNLSTADFVSRLRHGERGRGGLLQRHRLRASALQC